MSKKFNQTHLQQALGFVAAGHTLSQIAHSLGFAVSTVNEHLLSEPELYADAKERRADLIRSERWSRAFDRQDKWSAKFLDDLALEQLPETREARKPQLAQTSAEEDRSAEIAAAIDRFSALVVRLAESRRAELPPGEADERGDSGARAPVAGVDSPS